MARGQVGAVYMDGDAPSCAGLAWDKPRPFEREQHVVDRWWRDLEEACMSAWAGERP